MPRGCKLESELYTTNAVRISYFYWVNGGLKYKHYTLNDAIEIRHHIVHRNGRNYRGESVPIDKEMVEKLIVEVDSFVETVASQLPID